jgi:hypothetical protein
MHEPTTGLANQLFRFLTGRKMWLKVPGLFNRNCLIESEADKWLGVLQHVVVTVGQNGQAIAPLQVLECRNDFRKRS